MNQLQATQAIFAKFKDLAENELILPVKLPNGDNFISDGNPYIDLFDTPNTTTRFPINCHTHQGIITANVYYKSKDYGDLFGKSEGQKIIDNIPDGYKFGGGIEIYQPPQIGSFIDRNDGWWYNPITILYEFINTRGN